MTQTSVADWLTGGWRRLSIVTGDGQQDTTTQVIWLQTHTLFGDIRIPAGRAAVAASRQWVWPQGETLQLSRQQGFAGVTELQGDICQWHRQLDYQPPSGDRDIGSLHWEGDRLIELGVESDYREEWQRLPESDGARIALTYHGAATSDAASQPDPWQALLVVTGDYFIYAQDRRPPLPQAEGLAVLMGLSGHGDGGDRPSSVAPYLDCEISFGRCQSGAIPWEIQLSTLPWRQGTPLWHPADLRVDRAAGQMLQTVEPSGGDSGQAQRCWTIREWIADADPCLGG